jgi:rhodanese-related sulfurtransferase
MKKRFAFLVTVVLAAALVGLPVVASAAKYPDTVKQLVMEARKDIKTIDMDAFKKVVDNPGDAMIIDVREPNEYAAGHVPHAINIPRGLIEFKIWSHVGFPDKTNMNQKMYLYCASGGRCSLAGKSLHDLGFTDVTAVPMMLVDWQKAGYPLVK